MKNISGENYNTEVMLLINNYIKMQKMQCPEQFKNFNQEDFSRYYDTIYNIFNEMSCAKNNVKVKIK